jgi:hypothetical protein
MRLKINDFSDPQINGFIALIKTRHEKPLRSAMAEGLCRKRAGEPGLRPGQLIPSAARVS